MALVTKITHQQLEKGSPHQEVDCTYDMVIDPHGEKLLQLDTYGSKRRQIKGKKSQSIRLSPKAIVQLKAIIQQHGL